jgi:uncharacterized protein affecting Mg2+/Co2+ transport
MIRLPRRPIRYLPLLALAAAVALAPAAPASAAAPVADLNCTITVTVDLHPGLTPATQHLVTTSHGLTGTATCTGTVGGQPVTGTGSFAINSQSTATNCVANGAGSFVLRIPTTGGTQTVAGRFTFTTTGAVSTISGDLTGTSTIISTVGDCFTTPITQATAVFVVHVT